MGLRLSPDAAKKSTFIKHLGKCKWKVAPFRLVLLPSNYLKAIQDTLLKEKVEINMVTTRAKSVEQDQLTPKLPDLQIKVWDIFETSDK